MDFKLNIVGKGNDEVFIKNLIIDYKLQGKVNLVGFTLDITKWYKDASIVVVPSRWQEPFCLIGGEAYSYFKPVVGFDVGGISEWLEDGKTGFLVKENDVKTFAEKIEYLLNNSSEAVKFGIAGNRLIKEKFNERIYIEKIEKILGEPNE